jgi:2-C-methyl-D-erythritol 4-phosphate cytidylyltransferase
MTQTCPATQACRLETSRHPSDVCAVIAAGGAGERFGDPRGKQFVDVAGLPMVCWSLVAFDRAPSVASIVLVCPEGRMAEMRDCVLSLLTLDTPVRLAPSGRTRQDSCRSGLRQAPPDLPLVAIHDGARPLVTVDAIEHTCERVRRDASVDGAVCGQPAIDTLKLVEGDVVVATPDRSVYWTVQTPQVFRRTSVLAAHEQAAREGYEGTDDASLVEHAGGRVALVAAQRDNIKVTVPEDLRPVEAILEGRLAAPSLRED